MAYSWRLVVFLTIGVLHLAAFHAEAFTTSTVQSGNWSAPSTWSAGIVPQNGDTATISHAVNVDVDTVVGASAASGASQAITVMPGGSLTIASGVTLTVRGDVLLNNSPLTMAPGAIFQFDASAAQDPPSTAYRLQIGAAHNQLAARLNVNGAAANRCVIRSINLNGAANGYISDGGFLQGGMISAMFVDFIRVGSATTPTVSTANTGSSMFFLANAVFDGG